MIRVGDQRSEESWTHQQHARMVVFRRSVQPNRGMIVYLDVERSVVGQCPSVQVDSAPFECERGDCAGDICYAMWGSADACW